MAVRQLIVEILGNATKFNQSMGSATQSAGKFSNVLSGIGQGAGIAGFMGVANAASMATSAIVGFAQDSIQAASNLNEVMSKTDQVFGDSAQSVKDWSQTTATSMGLSQRASLEAASGFGNLLTTIGLAEKPAAEMSQSLVQLASDLSSFHNIDSASALEKLRAGLAGEAEPLRSLGVFLTEATVKAKAMEMGLASASGELTEGAKVQARYALILEQTAKAQGDFERTSDGMANQQRILSARLEETSAKFGTALMPAVLGAQEAFIGLFTAMDVVNGELPKTTEGTQAAWDSLTDLTGALGVLVPGMSLASEAMSNMDADTRSMTGSADNAGKAADDLAGKTEDLAETAEESAEKVAESFEDMKDSLVQSANDAIDNAYDPLINRDRLMAANAEIAAARRVLASKTASAAEKADAQETLASTGKSQAEYLLKLAEAGKTGYKAYKDGMASLKTAIANSSGSAKVALQEVLNKILAVEKAGAVVNVNIRVNQSGNIGVSGARAKGGPVTAGRMYEVNEDTPNSEYFMPSEDGTVLTRAQGNALMMGRGMGGGFGGGGGGGVTINLSAPIYGVDGVDQFADIIVKRMRTLGAW